MDNEDLCITSSPLVQLCGLVVSPPDVDADHDGRLLGVEAQLLLDQLQALVRRVRVPTLQEKYHSQEIVQKCVFNKSSKRLQKAHEKPFYRIRF